MNNCIKEGNPYVDFRERFEYRNGRGYWLELCLGQAILHSPPILQAFADNGVDIAETDKNGFNCLFVFMSRAKEPDTAKESRALQRLLTIFDFHDIRALDSTGNDIFSYVNELQEWPETCERSYFDCGSYKQDLWYCALNRSKLDVRYNIQPCGRLARYTEYYTPRHYLALCHLDEWDSWNKKAFEKQIQPVIQRYPLSEDEERIEQEMEAPLEWDIDKGGLL